MKKEDKILNGTEPDFFTDPTDHLLESWEIDLITKEMGIGDNGPLVDRAFSEALSFQFNREVVKNSIEAKSHTIRISPDWIHVKESKGEVYRYLIADDGQGMSGEELVKFFNLISSSGKIMDTHGNFGVGAKISLLPWNSKGLVVMSWKNGIGKMVKIIKKPNGNYALYRWEVLDESGTATGARADYVEAPIEYKPHWVSDHGTVIVAMGVSGKDDTFLGPTGDSVIKAHTHTLNTRFFDLPKDVNISVFEFTNSEKSKWPVQEATSTVDGGMYRSVRGARYYLDEFSVVSGTVNLTGAVAHWWIRGKKNGSGNIHSFANERGYIAALYDNELYNLVSGGPEGRQRYLSFGILQDIVQRDITLVIEPNKLIKGQLDGAFPNTARSRLLYSGGELPWDKWGKEFLSSLPPEIQSLIENAAAVTYSPKDLADRLRPFLRRMHPTNFRLNENGKLRSVPNFKNRLPHRKISESPLPRSPSLPNDKPKKISVPRVMDSTIKNPTGEPSKKINPRQDLPEIKWISLENGTRSPGELEGRAAEYAENVHTLTINSDHFLFKQQLDYWTKQYSGIPGADAGILEIVRDVYSGELSLRIMHARSLEGTLTWEPSKFSQLLSPEALTLAVLGYIGADAQIAARSGGMFGSAAKMFKRVASSE